MKRAIILAFALAISGASTGDSLAQERIDCGGFDIEFDFTAFDALPPILDGRADMSALDTALELQSVQAIIRKGQQNVDISTADRLREEIEMYRAGETPDPVVFPLPEPDRLAELVAAAEQLRRSPDALFTPACERLEAYLPEDYDTDLKTIFVFAVYSAGFTFGDPVLHIGFHRMADDLAAMELVIVHELYHGAQGAYRPVTNDVLESLSELDRRALQYLTFGYLEGSAMWVADPQSFEGDGDMMTFFTERQHRALREIPSLFTLFEASLYQLHNDPGADTTALYAAGFRGEERNYNVGHAVAGTIVDEYGPERLAGLMTRRPTEFYRQYQNIDERRGPPLSDTFMAILDAVDAALDEAQPQAATHAE